MWGARRKKKGFWARDSPISSCVTHVFALLQLAISERGFLRPPPPPPPPRRGVCKEVGGRARPRKETRTDFGKKKGKKYTTKSRREKNTSSRWQFIFFLKKTLFDHKKRHQLLGFLYVATGWKKRGMLEGQVQYVHRRRSLVEEAPEGEEEQEEEQETSFCIYFVRKAFLSPFLRGG